MSIRKFLFRSAAKSARPGARLRKVYQILFAGMAVLAGLVLVLPASRLTLFGWLAGEPCYRGRPVSYWRYQLKDWRIDRCTGPISANERLQGRNFVQVFGYPGWDLEHRDSLAQRWYGEWWHIKWKGSAFWHPDYGDPFCRLEILDGDSTAVPVLTALLDEDEDIRIRRVAAAALGRIGLEGKAAFPALLETANRDEDAFLRGIARVALLDIDKEAAEKARISEFFMFWSPQPKLRATIEGCSYHNPLAFSTDARMLALYGQDETIKLCDAATGKEVAFVQPHIHVVWPVVFSSDGKTLAAASKDKAVKLWDLAGRNDLTSLEGHTDKVTCVAFSPDGKTLASVSKDKTLKLWDVTGRKELTSLRGKTGEVTSMAFSPDGKTLASGSNDKTVKLWDVAGGKEKSSLQGHTGGIIDLAFSPDGKTLVSASGPMDYSVKLWDVATGQERTTLQGYESNYDEWVDSIPIAFSPDGQILAFVSADTIYLWNVASGKNIATILAAREHVGAVVFTPDGKMLAVGGDDSKVRLWEFTAVSEVKK